MHIDIFSDIICPWCYIGKRRLERALARWPQNGLTVRWRAFQLNPDMPAQGMDRRVYLQVKFGGAEAAERVYAQIRAAGTAEDIPFAFDAITRTPNSVDGHRLVRFAARRGREDEMVEALFRAYFLDGCDLSRSDELVAAAAGAGFEAAEVGAFLAGGEEVEAVRAEDLGARRAGIQGVPTFIVNGKYALSGAHQPEVLRQMFEIGRSDDAAAHGDEAPPAAARRAGGAAT